MTTTSNEKKGIFWGKEWIRSLENLNTSWQSRMPRGKEYAAKGHVISLAVEEGKIVAKVQGSRSKPYITTIELPPFRGTEWIRVIKLLSHEARYPAQLLTGEMPQDLNNMLDHMGLSLFPMRNSEMIGGCSCPGKNRPCKHIAAAHYAFGDALNSDPFLLMQLRGANRAMLVKNFRYIWTGQEEVEKEEVNIDVMGIPITELGADRFNRSPQLMAPMSFQIIQANHADLILRRLGTPKSWNLPITVFDLLGPVYNETIRFAAKIALSSFDSADISPQKNAEDEALLSTSEAMSQPSGYTSVKIRASISEALKEVESGSSNARFLNKNKRKITNYEPQKEIITARNTHIHNRRGRRMIDFTQQDSPSPYSSQAEFANHLAETNISRRSGRRLMVVKTNRKHRKIDRTAGLNAKIRKVMGHNDYRKAAKIAIQMWQTTPTIPYLLLLLVNANFDTHWKTIIRDEADRSLANAVRNGQTLILAEYALLLSAGKYGVVAEIMDSQGAEGWTSMDRPADMFVSFALRALTRKSKIHRPAINTLWKRLLVPVKGYPWSESPPSLGECLEISVKKIQISKSERKRLLEVSEVLVKHLIKLAPRAPKNIKIENFIVAIAETKRILFGHLNAMTFLAQIQEDVAVNIELAENVGKLVSGSPALNL